MFWLKHLLEDIVLLDNLNVLLEELHKRYLSPSKFQFDACASLEGIIVGCAVDFPVDVQKSGVEAITFNDIQVTLDLGYEVAGVFSKVGYLSSYRNLLLILGLDLMFYEPSLWDLQCQNFTQLDVC
ncbi:hypothetical protein NE237_020265 [Protea cynaroides]|uniref:Uncharacterized protein n=1 Tax=Protea cynaroides TaxID=273540 RepID=A0A9Q0H932_9MAGN|nr:hypothetical protein NE237_020265 [Protea cynaroides]